MEDGNETADMDAKDTNELEHELAAAVEEALPIQTLRAAQAAMVEMASVSLPTGNMNNLKQRTKGVD